LFRTFQAENFIIPTGSMAPGLMGQHMDVTCAKCGYAYQAGASGESSLTAPSNRNMVTHTTCPICNYRMAMDRKRNPDHTSNQGDRIVVDKFLYDFIEPDRFEVIVFKNPNNGKQNYIKRLVGVPGDQLTIEHGDIFQMSRDGDQWVKTIVRKPADKVRVMMQLVDDTHHIPKLLHEAGWPLRWQAWQAGSSSPWETVVSQHQPIYRIQANAGAPVWLRYRHHAPTDEAWSFMESTGTAPDWILKSPGRLIGDFYAYNHSETRPVSGLPLGMNGIHWVGDLGLQAQIDIVSNGGTLWLDTVEGGAHFTCEIDCQSGKATLTCSDPNVKFVDGEGAEVARPSGETPLRQPGSFDVLFANVDDQLFLWVNGKQVIFNASAYQRPRPIYPRWSNADPGDAEPLGIAVQDIQMTIHRLKVWRDIYYTSARGNKSAANEFEPLTVEVLQMMYNPQTWNTPEARRILDRRNRDGGPMFILESGQYLPLGDNSPQSMDSRIWYGPNYVDREMLIGRALYVFWPHPLNRPIPFFPNFGKMRRIR
ncbi:MAG TPA: signal peptidase I, partial [Pirellulaceae bacterium]|nr:signal peptidase I [Pirellulaceae bacterium]